MEYFIVALLGGGEWGGGQPLHPCFCAELRREFHTPSPLAARLCIQHGAPPCERRVSLFLRGAVCGMHRGFSAGLFTAGEGDGGTILRNFARLDCNFFSLRAPGGGVQTGPRGPYTLAIFSHGDRSIGERATSNHQLNALDISSKLLRLFS